MRAGRASMRRAQWRADRCAQKPKVSGVLEIPDFHDAAQGTMGAAPNFPLPKEGNGILVPQIHQEEMSGETVASPYGPGVI